MREKHERTEGEPERKDAAMRFHDSLWKIDGGNLATFCSCEEWSKNVTTH